MWSPKGAQEGLDKGWNKQSFYVKWLFEVLDSTTKEKSETEEQEHRNETRHPITPETTKPHEESLEKGAFFSSESCLDHTDQFPVMTWLGSVLSVIEVWTHFGRRNSNVVQWKQCFFCFCLMTKPVFWWILPTCYVINCRGSIFVHFCSTLARGFPALLTDSGQFIYRDFKLAELRSLRGNIFCR